MPLEENVMLGPYRIVSMLGEGGMGAVYRAKDTRLGRDVAVKVLTAVTLSDQERLVRFEQEARTTGMLNHPNLLTIFDIGNHEGTPYLVSELLEGETLRDRLARGALSSRKAVDAALQMAFGLAAAHEKGIVHRDLKPENIFLGRDGRLKILDFGIAKLTARGASDGPTFQMAATEPGMVLGTVGYMSPEQVRGESVDHRSDIFAFGTILYEMLTGNRAFKKTSSIETLSAILKEDPPELLDVLPNTPPALDRLVRRCLEKDRDSRFQTSRDLAFNLETLSTMSASTLSGSAPAAPSRQHPTPGSGTATMRHAPATGASPAHTPTIRTSIPPTAGLRPRSTTMISKPKRRVSTLLLTLLYLVSIAGAAFAGWKLASSMKEATTEATFQRVTFRRGEVRSARFTPDGDTIVYSAAWDGNPAEIFVAPRLAPDARPLGIPDAEILAVSKSSELAILLRRNRFTQLGTLARVPLAGGVPREVATDVLNADWSGDGASLAVIRNLSGKYRVEFPIGRVRHETTRPIHDVRVSPDGTKLAFIELINRENTLSVIDKGDAVSIAHGWQRGVTGLAWAPDGKEIWITGTSTSAPPALYAIPLEGDTRMISRLTGSMKLFDISRAGRTLLSNGVWRAALMWKPSAESPEHDTSWLDWSVVVDLSTDGRTILFNEPREGGGAKGGMYLRRLGEPVPVRIGDGLGDAISPDGKWVLGHAGSKLQILPTGTGEARELKIEGNFDQGAVWLPDSKRVVVGNASGQLTLVDTLDEKTTPLSPDGIWNAGIRAFAVAPDARFVAGMNADETIVLYPIDGSLTPSAVPGVEKGEIPIEFSADGAALYVYRPNALPASVQRIELATGARTLWREFSPADPAGVYKISPVLVTPDGNAYAYDALRTLSDLYVAEGLK